MKIKKMYQGTLPENRILNTQSDSQTDTYSCDYINSKSSTVSATEPTNGEEVWFKKSKNLFYNNYSNLWIDTVSGTFYKMNIGYGFKSYQVEHNTTYTISKKNIGNRFIVVSSVEPIEEGSRYSRIIFSEDHSKTEFTFTTNSTDNYIYLCFYNGNSQSELELASQEVQLEMGDSRTQFEPFVEKAIYTKNDNNIYEEFYNGQDVQKMKQVFNNDITKVNSNSININYVGNIDEVTQAGIYRHDFSDGGTNPTGLGGNSCMFLVAISNDTYNAQLAFGFGSDKIAIRRRNGSTTWSSWKYATLS